MILIIQNQTGSTLSYLSGSITVAANSSTNVTSNFQIILSTDGQLRQDILDGKVFISDGVNTYGTNDATTYLLLFAINAVAVNTSPGLVNSNLILNYNEVTNISPGIETTIASYTANPTTNCYLLDVNTSGTNVAEYRIYLNSTIIDKQYSYYTNFNNQFSYKTNEPSSIGLKISSGDVIYIKAIQNSVGVCNFNAKIQVLEVS